MSQISHYQTLRRKIDNPSKRQICLSKLRFLDKKEAYRHIREIKNKIENYHKLEPYQCPVCHCWHLRSC